MKTAQGTIEIHAPVSVCYNKWLHLPPCLDFQATLPESAAWRTHEHWACQIQTPSMPPHGLSMQLPKEDALWVVETRREDRSHKVEWLALADSDVSWDCDFSFVNVNSNTTELKWVLFRSDVDSAKDASQDWLPFLKAWIQERAMFFKQYVEMGHMPSATQSDAFVLKAVEMPANHESVSGYQGPYGLDWDLDEQEMSRMNIADGGIEAQEGGEPLPLEMQSSEVAEYLGADASVAKGDLIDMRADDDSDAERADIFEDSLDVGNEDLESFTEDLDEEIDSALGLSGEDWPVKSPATPTEPNSSQSRDSPP